MTKYVELRKFTKWLFNKIAACDGFLFYVGTKKTTAPVAHHSNRLYTRVFLEAIKRIDEFCAVDCSPPADFALILDEHDQRSALITAAAASQACTGARGNKRARGPWGAQAVPQ